MQTEVLYGNGLRTSYTYDDRSLLTGMDATTPLKVMETCYTFGSMERLTKESLNGAVTSYGYDLAGNRITKSTDGRTHYDAEGYRDSITEKDKVTNFVYQGGMLLHELDEDKNPARHYVIGNEYIGLDHNYQLCGSKEGEKNQKH